MVWLTRFEDEVSCRSHAQLAGYRHQANEPLSAFRAFTKNKGSKETAWSVYTTPYMRPC